MMRRILLLCAGLFLIAGCNAVVTEEQAHSTCDAAGVSEIVYNQAISFAERDQADGLSSVESMALARGGCVNLCDDPDDDANCLSDCTTCTNAVVLSVYSQ